MMQSNPSAKISYLFQHHVMTMEDLWPNKYFIVVDSSSGEIHIYDSSNLQALHIIRWPFIQPSQIKSNQKQSHSLFCNKKHDYFVLKAITNSDV